MTGAIANNLRTLAKFMNKNNFYHLDDETPTASDNNHNPKPDNTNISTEPASDKKQNAEPSAMMLRVLLQPNDGWRAFKQCKFKSQTVERRCFYPLCALAAAGCFFTKIYAPDIEMQDLLIRGLVVFMSFFFGYFLIMQLCKSALPSDSRSKMESAFGRNFILLGLSCQALFCFIQEALQILEPILVFLPLLTIYVLSKGVKFLRVQKEKETLTAALTALYIIGIPMMLEWLFNYILPQHSI